MNKTLISIMTMVLLVGGVAFYSGMRYTQSKTPFGFAQGDFENFQDLSPEQRQQFFQGILQGNMGENFQKGVGGRAGTGFLNGEVIAKDEQSLTLKMSDGGSKIVFFSDSTKISKTIEGSIDDIEIGKQIMVSGEQNSDGSYTTQTIQLSPYHLGR